jgi:hypothetical protein
LLGQGKAATNQDDIRPFPSPSQGRALKRGTLCYVVTSCRASPAARRAVGKIVEVVAGPYERHNGGRLGVYYDVCHRGTTLYCQADKLRPINDPDLDLGEHCGPTAPRDGSLH